MIRIFGERNKKMMKLLTALVLIEALLLIWVFAVEPRLLRVSRYQL